MRITSEFLKDGEYAVAIDCLPMAKEVESVLQDTFACRLLPFFDGYGRLNVEVDPQWVFNVPFRGEAPDVLRSIADQFRKFADELDELAEQPAKIPAAAVA